MELRPYQREAIQSMIDAEREGCRRQLLVMATGLGKTVVFSHVLRMRSRFGRGLVIVHRDELAAQAAEKIRSICPDLTVGIVKAERNEVDADVVIASVQTLSRASRLSELMAASAENSGRLDLAARNVPTEFATVIVDEAHHVVAENSYGQVLGSVKAGLPDGPWLLGVTATPSRLDGQALTPFDQVVSSLDLRWGIAAGYLAEVVGRRVIVAGLDWSKVRVRAGDFVASQAGAALIDASAQHVIVEAWVREAAGRQTIVFAPTVGASIAITQAFRAAGITAAHIDGSTPQDERADYIARYRAGEITVLSNCMVLTEGFDAPETSCIVVAAPTKSPPKYAQQVGRGTRRHPNKNDCLVIDVAGVSETLDLQQLPQLFGIKEPKIRDRLMSGTSTASECVADQIVADQRAGIVSMADAKLIKAAEKSGLVWVRAATDAHLAYVRPIPEGPTVALWSDTPESWRVVVISREKGASPVTRARNLDLETAQGIGEDAVRKLAENWEMLRRDAKWRRGRKSASQTELAEKLGIDHAKMKKGDLSDAITATIAARTLRRVS